MNNQNRKGRWFIGTSGWQYKHWKKLFYPEDIMAKEWLDFYQENFKAVELNSSFYHQPKKQVFAGWQRAVTPGFIFAVKAPRFFTHLKKLSVSEEELSAFISSARALGGHLGPILFQLPPRWHLNLERMADFVGKLPGGIRVTIEFRDASWYTPELYALLEKNDIAFCVYELGGHQSPVIAAASFVYVRLHGPAGKYRGSYADQALERWATQIMKWTRQGKDVYVFFDNDESAYAPHNAAQLQKILGEH